MRKIVAWFLIKCARHYIQKYQPTVIVITGSVGKTSTTQAIASVLSQQFQVRHTIGNYNTDVGVPCSIFSQKLPANVKNPVSWFFLMCRVWVASRRLQPFDTLVLELGTDTAGEIEQFAYLRPAFAVVTAIAPEHMEYFGTLDAVASEELSVARYAEQTLVNSDMVDKKYMALLEGLSYRLFDRLLLVKYEISIQELQVIGQHSLHAVAAAVAVAEQLGMKSSDIRQAALLIEPQAGRMKQFMGIKQSRLIDDTYNASPEATKAALEFVYEQQAPQKIALLGNMNELGQVSESAHREIGRLCDPKQLDLVVTLGPEANMYLAEEAEKSHCHVFRATTPTEAAQYIKKHLTPGALVLLKGSQNNVYAEEATKLLLANPQQDASQLVRQSASWLKKKQACFEKAQS